MQLLTTFLGCFRSRQKLLIKRRKIQLKNRPISSKRLKEQRQIMNISYETKLVQIKKQLDRKKSQNHHINQIVEELFYPEVQLQNQQQIEMRAKQMANDAALLGEDWEEVLQMDDLTQSIKENYLPVDLLALHEQRWQEFTPRHYQVFMDRMSYYCFNQEKIKKKMMDHWQRLVKKMQEKQGKNKPIRCPYLFLQKQQITRHEHWDSLTKQLLRKMTQTKDITTFNQYLPIILMIQRLFNMVPADIYQLTFSRNATANFNDLSSTDISRLMRLLRYKNKIKYDPLIRINPERENQQASISHFTRKLATSIIEHPQNYTTQDFMNIFIFVIANNKRFAILTQQLLAKSQTIAANILNDLPFDKVLTYMTVYANFKEKPNMEFLQILKFDLYRKCDNENNYYPLLLLINKIKKRKLWFKTIPSDKSGQLEISLDAYELLLKTIAAISKMISKLKSDQLISLLNSCYNNELYRHTAIEIISTEFVKKGSQFDLQTLAKGFFKISLLGHRSKILARYVFEEYLKRYHQQAKKYKEDQNLLLPTEENVRPAPAVNPKVVHLQQCLLMTIWGVIHHLGANLKTSVNLNDLLTLIPIQLESSDPLAIKIAGNINQKLKPFGFFPKIIAITSSSITPDGRLKEFYKYFEPKTEEVVKKDLEDKKQETKFYDLLL